MTAAGKIFKEGDWISLNGSTGNVLEGQIATIDPELSGDFGAILDLAEKHTRMDVRTNADTPHDAQVARDFGAKGIGLTRTEHMFFEGDRIKAMREMILATNEEDRRKALDKLLPYQREDFEGILEAMEGFGVTIRLLDPPLHEFVPHDDANQQVMADEMGITVNDIKALVEDLHEFNPMLGHRGCRLGNTYPEITEMQARAIIEAAVNLTQKGVDARPEIMVPLIGTWKEFKMQEEIIRATADKVFEEKGASCDYQVGTMIEIPRAAMTADLVAQHAEFFSFGTNDLTQMAFGYSRDDAGKFLPIYIEKGLLKNDPFQTLDQEGVGQLVEMGTSRGRSTNPDLKVGICGEHGGDPESVEFCHRVGMDYVSCSPFRVPIARLAAAQAAIR
jgi:pyruvate,orthophosphate dikinase